MDLFSLENKRYGSTFIVTWKKRYRQKSHLRAEVHVRAVVVDTVEAPTNRILGARRLIPLKQTVALDSGCSRERENEWTVK